MPSQRQGVLDGGVAGADDHDVHVLPLVGICERVDDMGELLARRTELSRRALHSQGQHDIPGGSDFATMGDLEQRTVLAKPRDLGVADVHAGLSDGALPALEDRFAIAFLEVHARA